MRLAILQVKDRYAGGGWTAGPGEAGGQHNTLSRFETELLVTEENQKGLNQLNAEW